MEGVSSKLISDQMKSGHVWLLEKDGLMDFLAEKLKTGQEQKLLITAGAGDIDAMVQPKKK